MYIRQAKTEDAPAACAIIRQSIAELCHADHGGDEVLLGKWLSNQTEAMALADRIAILHAGRIQQIGPPAEVYTFRGIVTETSVGRAPHRI
jgi:ABC-type sulfate/molybdate transport systems ATPase subunit